MECKYKIDETTIYKFPMPLIASNMYIMLNGNKALVIDPNICEEAVQFLKEHHVDEIIMILTHEHFDHISGVNYFRENWKCKVIGNKACMESVGKATKNLSAYFMAMFITFTEEDRKAAQKLFQEDYTCKVDESFSESMKFDFGKLSCSLIETPGHSPCSICILVNDRYIFTGDSLVQGARIITRLPGGNKELYKKVTKPFLESLKKDTIVFPGHGEESYLDELEIV